ncbi:MFS transporter [Amycolatopsis echigonensis]|uniref:MFS family arabinose efflux permease n=1 Tax=Amycolatopsis echigonensis TaxID=2576905 RepID=A0A2N3X053_9PSEU|nr:MULTISPECIES: MFS transporter [Amycolatopsis]MBB2503636.1 MFS transporter [Amycolatopsis echigonensis]PKV99495.1 putative MFS family arabinose efflux permease [Amycolatopsis niigatensis]
MASTSTEPHRQTRSLAARRPLVALGLGGTLEWYDWQIFGLLSAFVGPQFFPNHDPVAATLSALAVFAVGFVFRPLGGVVLGLVADRFGRRRVMLGSVAAMALATLVIAVVPGYASLGVWSGVILLICRVVQGVSTGVEGPLATAYAVELTAKGREGRAAGIMSLFVNLGILGASLISFITSAAIGGAAMQSWGWRVPMAFGAVLGIVIVYMRRQLPESLHTSAAEHRPANSNREVWRGIGKHWLALLAMIFVVGAVQAYNYAWNVGLPTLARSTYKENATSVFAITTLLGVVLVIGSLLTGALADRKKLSRTFVVTRLLAVPAVFLMLLYAGPGLGGFSAVLLGGGLVLVLNMTLYNVVSTSLLPAPCRATGVGLGYGIGVALFGGTASYLLVWLGKYGSPWMFPAYTAALCLISVALYLAARRRTGIYAGE